MKYLVNGVEAELSETLPGFSASSVNGQVILKGPAGAKSAVVRQAGSKTFISYEGRVFEIEPIRKDRKKGGSTSGELKALMPGLIVEVCVQKGENVVKGQKLVVLEAMKTQQPIESPFDGTVDQVFVEKGQQVTDGEKLVKVLAILP